MLHTAYRVRVRYKKLYVASISYNHIANTVQDRYDDEEFIFVVVSRFLDTGIVQDQTIKTTSTVTAR